MDEIGGQLVIEILDAERPLDFVHSGFGRRDDAFLFVDVVVHITLETASDAGEAVVELGGFAHSTADDQWRARLVDQDRVDFVDDAIHRAALHLVFERHRHVVA